MKRKLFLLAVFAATLLLAGSEASACNCGANPYYSHNYSPTYTAPYYPNYSTYHRPYSYTQPRYLTPYGNYVQTHAYIQPAVRNGYVQQSYRPRYVAAPQFYYWWW